MVIQQLFSAAPPAPAQLGAADLSLPLAAGKALSVKGYSQGWASYQSPAANQVLRELNMGLRVLGFDNIPAYHNIIDARSVAAVKLLASVASSPAYAGIQLYSAGGTAGYAGNILRRFSTAEALAKNGVEARFYINALGQNAAFVGIMKTINRGQPAASAPTVVVNSPSNPSTSVPITTPSPNTTPSAPTYDPSAYTSPGPGPAKPMPKWAWGVAGGILLIGLGTATYFVWR